MTKPANTWKLGLYLNKELFQRDGLTTSDSDLASFTATIRPVIVGNHPDDYRAEDPDAIRNTTDHHDYKGLYLDDLEIIAWAREPKTDTGRAVWHWEFHYKPHTVDLANAARLAHAVKTIGARLSKLNEENGRPDTFTAFVRHMAQAIKADCFVVDQGPNTTGRWGYEGINHAILPIGEGINHLCYKIERFLHPEPK